MEEAAILAAIAQFPHEDTPRLAYADWLDDHADALPEPDAARIRAEFIRLQCELKRYEDVTRAEQNRYIDLYRRQDAILTRHRRDLLGPMGESLSDIEMSRDVVFDRGFVTELRLHERQFAEHAGAVANLKPRPAVKIFCERNALNRFLRDAPTELVSSLIVHAREHNPWDWEAALESFIQQDWPRLRELNVGGCDLGDAGLQALAQRGHFPALTKLDLTGNEISDEGLRHLVNSPLWARLEELILDANPISDEGAAILANAAAVSRLEYLNLKRTGITSDGHRVLFRGFPRRTKLDLF
jgi:uncharacterized protein (TIGR02996 family)